MSEDSESVGTAFWRLERKFVMGTKILKMAPLEFGVSRSNCDG